MRRLALLDPAWQDRLAAAGLPDPAALLADPLRLPGRWEPLTKPGLGGRERWRWNTSTGEVLYLKRYLRTSLREQFDRIRRQAARHSRAWWEYAQAENLAARRIPAVRAVAVAEEMRGLREMCSAVLFDAVPGDALDRAWTARCAARPDLAAGYPRHELTRGLARFIAAFHETGICHRDLYLCHVFTDLAGDADRPPRLTLIDLARTHRPRLRRLRWVLKDLSQLDCSARQLAASRADRLRFLVAYLGLQPDAPRVRWYVRRIVRRSDRILRRIARKAAS